MKTQKEMILVVGMDDKQKPHAARFDLAMAEAVRKAAGSMSFRTAIPRTEEGIALAERLPPGKLFSSGKGMVAYCKAETYEKLMAAVELEAAPKDSAEASPASKAPAGPKSGDKSGKAVASDPWADLKVGDKVIAPEKRPSEEGWWPCVITAASKDGKMLTLRWLDNPKQPPVTLKRRAVALLHTA